MSSFNLSQNQKWQYNVRERDQHEACEIWQRGFEREYVEAKTCRRNRRGSSHLSVLRESSRGRELRWALPASRHRVGVGAGPRRAEEGYQGPCWIEIRRRFLRSLSLSLSSASTTSTATWKCELKNKKKKREWDEAEGEGEFGLNRVRLGFGLETSRSLGFLRFWSFEHSTQFPSSSSSSVVWSATVSVWEILVSIRTRKLGRTQTKNKTWVWMDHKIVLNSNPFYLNPIWPEFCRFMPIFDPIMKPYKILNYSNSC